MNFEQPEKESPVERTEDELRLHNRIQIELMKRYARIHNLSNDDAAMEWTDKRHFSRAFSDMVKEHQDLYAEFERDPEGTLARIEARLYGGEELREAA